MFGFRQKNRKRRPLGERAKSAGQTLGKAGKKALPIACLLAVAIGLPYGIFHAYIRTVSGSYFELDEVDVDGLAHLERGPVLDTAGLVAGRNIFDIDIDRADKALEANAWVKQARVDRRLPDQIVVDITEYEPVAVLVDQGYHLVDADAVVFDQMSADDQSGAMMALPMITGLEVRRLDKPVGRQLFDEAIAVVRMYDEMGLTKWETLSEIHVDPVVGLTLITADTGVEIRLGAGQYRARLERLGAVQQSIDKRAMEVDYILLDQQSDLSRVAVGRRHHRPGRAANAQPVH